MGWALSDKGRGAESPPTEEPKGLRQEAGKLGSNTETHHDGSKKRLSEIVSENSAQVSDNMMKMYREGHAIGQESARVKYEDRLRVLQEKVEGLQESMMRLERESNGHKARFGALQDELSLLR